MADHTLCEPVDLEIGAGNLLHSPGDLPMTRDAPTHRLINNSRHAIHFLYQTVTGLARNLSPEMWHMREEDMR